MVWLCLKTEQAAIPRHEHHFVELMYQFPKMLPRNIANWILRQS